MKRILLTGGFIVLGASIVLAQTPPPAAQPSAAPPAGTQSISSQLGAIVYPAKGQSAAKQSTDEQECYVWSKGQTGHDPFAPPPAPAQASTAAPPPENTADGSRLRGAARGAAAGAVVGEVANNDADEGAAIGAAAGAVAGGRQKRKAEAQKQQQAQEQAQQQQQQAQAAQTEQLNTFKKAFGVCLQGRGYTTG
jgi:hypothetical protein